MERWSLQHHRSRCATRVTILAGLLALAASGALAQAAALPASGKVLTLRDCAQIALESSPRLGIAASETEIADKNVRDAVGAFLPNVSLSASYSRSDRTDFDSQYAIYGPGEYPYRGSNPDTLWLPTQVQTGVGQQDVNVRSTYKDFGASAGLRLFDGLANVNSLKSARRSREAAGFSQDYMRELVVQNVAMAYYGLLRYLALRDVKVEDLQRAEKELEKTETYFRLGSAAKADVLQQRVFVKNVKLELVVAENNVKQARADLAYAMNQPLAEDFDIDRSALQSDLELETIAPLYQEAQQNRLDLKASEQTAEARRLGATVASGAFWPRLDLGASYSRYFNESPYRFGSDRSASFSWRASVSWDVFNRFQNFTNRSRAKANARISEYNLEQSRLDAQLEVRRFHIAMTEAIERRDLSRETIAQAQEEVRLANERFRVGAGTNLDRISAEVNLAQARADEVQAVCDFLIARAQLWRAVGRFSNLIQGNL